jgi:hypothetical protein
MQRDAGSSGFWFSVRVLLPFAAIACFVTYFFSALLYPRPLVLALLYVSLCLSVVAWLTEYLFRGAYDA